MHPKIFISHASVDTPIAKELDSAFKGNITRLPWNIDHALWLNIAQKSDAIVLVCCSGPTAEIVSLLNWVHGTNKLLCILLVGSVTLPNGLDERNLRYRFGHLLKIDADGPPLSRSLLDRLVSEVQSRTSGGEPQSLSGGERRAAAASYIGSSGSSPIDFILCPQCRGTYPPGTQFCGRCGITIPNSSSSAPKRSCSQCGGQYYAGETFCRGCGRRWDAAEPVTGQLSPACDLLVVAPAQPRQRMVESSSEMTAPASSPPPLASTGVPQPVETARPRADTASGNLAPPTYASPPVYSSSPAYPSVSASSPPPMFTEARRPSLFEKVKEGARIIADGLRSLASPSTSNAPVTASPPTPTEKVLTRDEVRCSVFAPSYAKQGQTFLIQVFAHLVEQASEAAKLASEFDDATQRQGFRTLEKEIERGSRLAFQLTVPGLDIEEPVQDLIWRASLEPEAVQFRVRVPPVHPTEPVIGKVTVSRNTVPIGHITFKLLIVSHNLEASDTPTREERPWTPYRKAFISYASEDRKEVLKRVQMLELQGITFFQDFLSLDPGQRWERKLYREIDRSDVFYLFWSSAARKSEWVMKEVNYALQRKGDDDSLPPAIVPVIIEGPPPVPPPPELAHLHFNHYLIYFMR